MTYWLIIFEIPTPKESMGAMKYKISRARYEGICELHEPTIDCDSGMFQLLTKRIFSIEGENLAFIISDGKRIRKE